MVGGKSRVEGVLPDDIADEGILVRGASIVVAVAAPLVDEGGAVGFDSIFDGAVIGLVSREDWQESGDKIGETWRVVIVFESITF